MRTIALLVLASLTTPALAQTSGELLPPVAAFHGQSRNLMLPADHTWATPFEASGGTDSPDFRAAFDWLDRLVEDARELQMVTIGDSDEGRPIRMILASREGAKDARALQRNGRPTLFAHAGIHAGEIDGLDAGMMLLRDLTVLGRSDLLDRCNLLFIPILNVDGHERRSTTTRINQRGPVHQGWRTNRRNLNGNRDFMKLDTPEIRAVVRVIDEWQPDLYVDLHVTDGADYQYDITYGSNGPHAHSPTVATWLAQQLRPHVDARLRDVGHVPGDLVFAADGESMESGNFGWTAPPRFSNGYGDARQLASILVENHSLKPFDQRVLGNYVFLSACMDVLAKDFANLRAAMAQDRALRPTSLPIAFAVPDNAAPKTIEFLGIASSKEPSSVSGSEIVRWSGQPVTLSIPHIVANSPTQFVARPQRYYIPAAWSSIAERLQWHGIEVERTAERRVVECEMLRLPQAKIDDGNENPYEGHVRIACGAVVAEQRSLILEAGSFVVSTDQALGSLAVLLLEPQAPDSFFQWGFLLGCLQRTEYFESYAVEPMATKMLAEDPALKRAFEEKLLQDKEFAEDARARLEYFYGRTPYSDAEFRLYPIGRGL